MALHQTDRPGDVPLKAGVGKHQDYSAHEDRQDGEKSGRAFRTIGEVSTLLDLPQHVLRFWETRFSQIKPLKRGGNRRYYRPGDVELLRTIKTLLYDEGVTIKGVQKRFREQGVKAVVAEVCASIEGQTVPGEAQFGPQQSSSAPSSSDPQRDLDIPASAGPSQKTGVPADVLTDILKELKALRAMLD